MLLVILALLAQSASAQAPVITPAGDPSVNNDTIYRLAVDPAAYPQYASVLLLNDLVVRLEADGRGTRTIRQVVQVLKQTAVAGFGERRIQYSPDHEKFTLNWVRVLDKDGGEISSGPAQMQESDVPASTTNPIYVNRKDVRMSLGGVAAGVLIDLSFTIEETSPFHEGDSYTHFNVHTGALPAMRTRFIYEVPSSVKPVFTERNLDFRVEQGAANGRTAYSWSRKDVQPYRAEPFAPDTNPILMFVVASLPTTWTGVASWYSELAADRYALTPAIVTKVRELTSAAKTRIDTIRAVHRWVAQDIRYVSVSLGLGGYQPRLPEQTFTTGFGDCKDKATIFIAALRSMGIDAYPVLLHQSASLVKREHPSIRQFNHVVAAVRDGSGYLFGDLTSAFTPFGEVPVPSQGGFAVVVLPNGRAEEVVLPKMAPGSRSIRYDIVAELSASGTMSGFMEESNSGPGFEARRSAFGVPLDSARRATVMRGLVGLISGARADSMVGFNGRDLYVPVRYKIWFSNARGTASTGGAELFTFPFGVFPAAARVTSLRAMAPRKSAINAEEVLRSAPPTSVEIDMRVTLPAGWKVRVPDNVVVTSDFGTYATEYGQEGRVLRIRRREASAVGVYPASRLPDVIEFFRAISADENNRNIIIEKGG
jgi:transglutaminase-like putative cysteine protease